VQICQSVGLFQDKNVYFLNSKANTTLSSGIKERTGQEDRNGCYQTRPVIGTIVIDLVVL
jgi:hypothetical protein